MNLGVDAYKAARYGEAVAHFQKAVELDPDSILAKTYLATALSQNVVPGLDTPENLKTAQAAIGIFEEVLKSTPDDVNSMKQVAGIYYNTKQLDKGKEWQMKVLAVSPTDSDAAYTIGVIDWTEAHQNKLAALLPAGFVDDGKGNRTAPAAVMATIRQQNSALVEEGLHYLALAIQLRPDFDDAMQYLNLTYRQKADLDRDDPGALADDLEAAQEWTQKAMATRKANQERQKDADTTQQ